MFLEDTGRKNLKVGWIEVVCGSMFSGKTEELIRRLKRAEFANQEIKIFKPVIDTRYDEMKVVSHDAREIKSIPVSSSKEIIKHVGNAEVVGIDEAQFFDMDLPQVANDLANSGIRVIAAGLDMDFQGNPFGPMPNMLAVAEYVTKVHAICVKTGKLANYSHRKIADESIVKLGEKDIYEPLSREAFVEEKRKERLSSHSE